MINKHTPGTWTHSECRDSSPFNSMYVISNEEEDFAYVEDYNNPYNAERKEANAKLICASPELLLACQNMAKELETVINILDNRMDNEFVKTDLGRRLSAWFMDNSFSYEQGKKAIKKATE